MNGRRIAGVLLAALVGLGLPRGAAAQEAPPQEPVTTTKATVIKGRAPVSDRTLRVMLPRPVEKTLPNGLRIMVVEDHRAPQVRFEITIPGAGGYFDPADRRGLSQFTASMLREGAGSRTGAQIAEQLERLAASLDVTSGMATEDASLSATCLVEHVDVVLALAADLLLRPTFPGPELERFKNRTRVSLTQQRTQPLFLANEFLVRAVYGDHPAGLSAPTPEAIEKTTRDSLVAFHASRYVPDHAVIAVIGDVSFASVVEKVQAALGAWKKAGAPAPEVTDAAPRSTPGIYLVNRPNSVQTVLRVGASSVRRTDTDFPTLAVLTRVVGGGSAGRLFRHLREDKGYTYGAYAFNVVTQRYAGHLSVTTDVRTAVTEPALNDALDELRQVREVPVPDKELSDARRALIASFALSLEQPSSVLTNVMRTWRWKLPADYWEKYPDQIAAVTAAGVQAAAKKYLATSRLQVIAVGDAAAIGPGLQKIGPVQVFDTEGKPVGAAPQ